jgi:hypothetical protein
MAIQQETRAKKLYIKVIDHAKEGDPVVNIKMPVGVIKWGLKMARTFSPEMKDVDMDWDSVTAMIEAGELGKIVEVEDEAQHKTVEIWLE